MNSFECISFKTVWFKFMFSKIKVCIVVILGHIEGIVEERERFWNDLVRNVDILGSVFMLCVMRDLNE